MTNTVNKASLNNQPDITKLQVNSAHGEIKASFKTPLKHPQKTDHAGIKHKHPTRLDPTRYGDWEKNGRCIDF